MYDVKFEVRRALRFHEDGRTMWAEFAFSIIANDHKQDARYWQETVEEALAGSSFKLEVQADEYVFVEIATDRKITWKDGALKPGMREPNVERRFRLVGSCRR
jgi:hypothetical protein